MSFFVCVIGEAANALPVGEQRAFESVARRLGLPVAWQSTDGAAFLTTPATTGHPLVARYRQAIAVGSARLDDRQALAAGAVSGASSTDLELVLRTVVRRGEYAIRDLVGDFAFVIWNPSDRRAVVACDPFAVRKLYVTNRRDLVAFSSRAEALSVDGSYDLQRLAELAASSNQSPRLTIYTGVSRWPAGTVGVVEHGALRTREYWSPSEVAPCPEWSRDEQGAARRCRELLADAVRARLGDDGTTWAELSGGLDSSSVVSITQWLVERCAVPGGIAGTVTYADQHGTSADERTYANAVTSRWGVPNRAIVDAPLWHDNRYPKPQLDEPGFNLMFYPRAAQLRETVQRAGGRVLLTGLGGDELFVGLMIFFADWVARGLVGPAVREMARRAAIGRVSFWQLAYWNAIVPFFPAPIRRRLVTGRQQLPPWIPPAIVRRYGLSASATSDFDGRPARKYHHAIVSRLGRLAQHTGYEQLGDVMDVRHPFLYRPLVEFALQLPADLCVRPYQRKWVLREAMRGILPEIVRTRIGKGSLTEPFARSLAVHRRLLEPLVEESALADLGVVDGSALRRAFTGGPSGNVRAVDLSANVQATLVLEAWLQLRSGRWPRVDCDGRTSMHAHN